MVRCRETVRESVRGLTLLCMTPFRRRTLLAARTPERLRALLCTEPCLSADPACGRTPERLRALLCTEPCLSADPACRRALDRPRTRIRVPNPALALRRRDSIQFNFICIAPIHNRSYLRALFKWSRSRPNSS